MLDSFHICLEKVGGLGNRIGFHRLVEALVPHEEVEKLMAVVNTALN